MLRVKMTGRETVFHLACARRNAKQVAAEHLSRFRYEMVPTGKKDKRGKIVYETRELPVDLFVFEYFDADDPDPDATGEIITLP